MDATTTERQRQILHLIQNEVSFETNTSILKNIVGQNEAIKKLMFFVKSHSPATPIPTFLFTGSQGLGKTYTAEKMAKAMGRQFIEVNCANIQTDKEFIEGILIDLVAGDTPKTLLLDEAHCLSSKVTNTLLTLLNPNSSNKNHLDYKGWLVEYDFSKINIIFATTDSYRMAPALLNRCTEIYFHLYSNPELYKILKSYMKEISIKCNRKDISWACRGRGRDTFVLSTYIQRYCSMENTKILDVKGWTAVKEIFDIYPLGLNAQEIKLLKLLSKHSPLSCHNIAIRLGVNERNVESELEIRPRELGFIENTSRGRKLSKEGKKYLEKIKLS